MSILFIDTETTGLPTKINGKLSYDSSRLIQLSYIITGFKKKVKVVRNLCIIQDTLPDSDYHKITENVMENYGIDVEEALANLYKHITQNNVKIIVGHNINFDKHVIINECLKIQKEKKKKNKLITFLCSTKPIYICTSSMTNSYTKIPLTNFKKNIQSGLSFPSYEELLKDDTVFKYPKLEELYFFCFNKKFSGAHDSFNDVTATMKCFFHIVFDVNCPSKILDLLNKNHQELLRWKNTKIQYINTTDTGFNNKKNNIITIVTGKKKFNINKKIYHMFCSRKYTKYAIHTSLPEECIDNFVSFCNNNKLRFIPKIIDKSLYNDKCYLHNIKDEKFISTLDNKKIINLKKAAKFFSCQYLLDVIKYTKIKDTHI